MKWQKKKLKIFFSGTDGLISMKVGMKHWGHNVKVSFHLDQHDLSQRPFIKDQIQVSVLKIIGPLVMISNPKHSLWILVSDSIVYPIFTYT